MHVMATLQQLPSVTCTLSRDELVKQVHVFVHQLFLIILKRMKWPNPMFAEVFLCRSIVKGGKYIGNLCKITIEKLMDGSNFVQ